MVQINFAQKEIQCKIVYYGPGMSGKTTNLELVHGKVPDEHRGELTSIATTGERTLYFDYMPLDLGQIAGIQTKFQLYTVPGQIYYKSTRRLVLQGVDGIVFVADSSRAKLRENKESLSDLEENLKEMGKELTDVPIIIQYNKRDIPDAMPVEELDAEMNPHGFPSIEAVAPRGEGVFPTLKKLASMVLEAVNKGGLATARSRSTPRPAKVTRPADAPQMATAAAASSAPSSHPKVAISRPIGGVPSAPSAPAAAGAASAVAAPPPRPASHPGTGGGNEPQQSGSHEASPPRGMQTHQVNRSVQDRIVAVSGLSGNGPNKMVVVLALGALIAGAAFFVLTRM